MSDRSVGVEWVEEEVVITQEAGDDASAGTVWKQPGSGLTWTRHDTVVCCCSGAGPGGSRITDPEVTGRRGPDGQLRGGPRLL